MKYYFVGIKGSGMAGLAQIIKDLGNEVKGADVNQHLFTENNLTDKGIIIESLDNMDYQDSDMIVLGNSFVNKYDFKDKETITYQELLSIINDKYYSIAICGTHGKTTTSNMIKHVLSAVDDVSYLIGDGQGKASKRGKFFVYEACEHREHFLNYYPNMIVCLNVDYDHVDYYESKKQYRKAFDDFFKHAKETLILNENVKINKNYNKITFGAKKANIIANNIRRTNKGFWFDLKENENIHEKLFLPFVGKHMLENALACITCCLQLNIDIVTIISKLKTYVSAKRRYNKTFVNNTILIDDYGHHPKEIKSTIESIKQEYPNKKIYIFFHPDRPKRLTKFAYDFIKAFKEAKKTFIFQFLKEGKEENNAIKSVINRKNIVEFTEEAIKEDYKDSVLLFTGSKEMKDIINKISSFRRKKK